MNELNLAKQHIQTFCRKEYNSDADFSDLRHIPIAHTDYEDDNHFYTVQVFVDLLEPQLITEYSGDAGKVIFEMYASVHHMNEALLKWLSFDDLVSGIFFLSEEEGV